MNKGRLFVLSAPSGTGKTTIINALSYALYGMALTNIKRNNLINKTNSKSWSAENRKRSFA